MEFELLIAVSVVVFGVMGFRESMRINKIEAWIQARNAERDGTIPPSAAP